MLTREGDSAANARLYTLRSASGNLPPTGPLPPLTWITQWAPDAELEDPAAHAAALLATSAENTLLRTRAVAAAPNERRALRRFAAATHALRLVLLSAHHSTREKRELAALVQVASYGCGARWPRLELDAKDVTALIIRAHAPVHSVTPNLVLVATLLVAVCATASLPAALLVSALFLASV